MKVDAFEQQARKNHIVVSGVKAGTDADGITTLLNQLLGTNLVASDIKYTLKLGREDQLEPKRVQSRFQRGKHENGGPEKKKQT